ncbi:MAG: DUF2784 domain-containing protein [Steroidobacteraceae bacterium]|jgi:hypothetical protein|nr:DUF2784 domain-containing protein [Steroidobacteraceae bacterium]
MTWKLLADAVLALHFAFVAFVTLGGLPVLRWPRLAWLHVPAVAWGAGISFVGAICPLTPLENALRHRAGESGYEGGFVEHYLLAVLYPDGLTREVQVGLGVAVLAVNLVAYGWLWRRSRRARSVR